MRLVCTVLSLTLLTLVSRGLAVQGDGDKHAKVLAPFVDDQTFVLAHIDVSKIDVNAVVKHLEAMNAPVPAKFQALAQLAKATLEASSKDIYVLMNWAHPLDEVLIVIPNIRKGTPPAVPTLIAETLGYRTKGIDDVLIAGPPKLLERFEKFRPVAAPEIAKALAAAGDGAVRVVVLPPPALRRALVEVFPDLPKEVGGGKSSGLDARWAALRVDLGEKPAAKLIIQGTDDRGAEELVRVLNRAAEFAVQTEEAKRDFPDLQKLLPLFKPDVKEGRVTLSLSEKDVAAVVLPLIAKQRTAAQRAQSANNLKQIGLALHNYHDQNKTFPAAGTTDAKGKQLLSWRVHILPYVEQDHLYRQFKLNEPWDSTHNKALIDKMPDLFRHPDSKADAGKTTYLAPIGAKTIFGGKKGMSIRQITDGTSNTILVVDADDSRAVVWTKPEDYKIDPKEPMAGLVRPGAQGFQVLFGDGSTRFISRSIKGETLRALYTASGGEPIDELP